LFKSSYSLAASLSLACACVMAQNPAAPLTFTVSGYRVQGNTLLEASKVEQATRPFTSPQASFETIQQALESLEKAYVSAGFGLVRVEIPEQELASGVVTLQVIEGVVSSVNVEPNAHFNADNIRQSLPALRQGEPVNIQALNRNLTLANEGGYKTSNVTFKRSDANREVEANVKLVAEQPERWLALVDNSGSESTGRFRLGVVYQNANLLNRDHSLSVQWLTSPDHLRDVNIVGLSYRVPLYSLGDAVDFNASRSSVSSGQVSSGGAGPDLSVSGSGLILGARYAHYLDASSELQQSFSLGLEHRAYGNSVTQTGSADSLVPDLTTHPLTLGYNANWRSAKRDVSLNLSWLKNLPGGRNGTTADFNQPGGRAGASATFQAVKINLQHTERFASQWSLRTGLSGQFTQDMLISPEQFGVGGPDSVRGFEERGISGDQGLRAGIEVWAPPVNADPWRMIALAFVDAARVTRNQPAVGEIAEQTVSSIGLGLRAAYRRNLTLRMDWGYVVKGVPTGASGPAKADQKLNATAAWLF